MLVLVSEFAFAIIPRCTGIAQNHKLIENSHIRKINDPDGAATKKSTPRRGREGRLKGARPGCRHNKTCPVICLRATFTHDFLLQ